MQGGQRQPCARALSWRMARCRTPTFSHEGTVWRNCIAENEMTEQEVRELAASMGFRLEKKDDEHYQLSRKIRDEEYVLTVSSLDRVLERLRQ